MDLRPLNPRRPALAAPGDLSGQAARSILPLSIGRSPFVPRPARDRASGARDMQARHA